MLLRRITKHVTDQNWFAVFIDFLIVVMGVFIGIQVANWNAVSQDREAETVLLDRLISEYERNREIIFEDKETSEAALSGTQNLLAMIAPKPDASITDESFAQVFLDCLSNPGFIPNLGVTNSLMASGNLSLIGDKRILSLLSQWRSDVEIISRWQDIERVHGEELIYGLVIEHVAMANVTPYFDRNSSVLRGKLTSDYQALLSSKRLEGLLSNRRFNTLASMKRLDELEIDTEKLIETLKVRKQEIL